MSKFQSLILKIYITWTKQAYFFGCCLNTPCLCHLKMSAAHEKRKKAKEKVSLVVCANATGTHEIPCTLIGKPKFPVRIKNWEWPVEYISQNVTWMEVFTCWKWFEEVFYPEVRKRTGRPVLLLMDNAPGHFPVFEGNKIKVVFFSSNCTSWKQTYDMGIIVALKKKKY